MQSSRKSCAIDRPRHLDYLVSYQKEGQLSVANSSKKARFSVSHHVSHLSRHALTLDTIHRNDAAFPEANKLLPSRWLNGKRSASEKYFIPFSYGPRACVGRNVATMELLKVLSNLLKRYHFELVDPNRETVLREGFLVKPTELWVRMTKREQLSH